MNWSTHHTWRRVDAVKFGTRLVTDDTTPSTPQLTKDSVFVQKRAATPASESNSRPALEERYAHGRRDENKGTDRRRAPSGAAADAMFPRGRLIDGHGRGDTVPP